MHKSRKTLSLNRETLRALRPVELPGARLAGGATLHTVCGTCPAQTCLTCHVVSICEICEAT